MIPDDQITIDGDTALVVGTEWWATNIMRDAQNRPCDTCVSWGGRNATFKNCRDCDGKGWVYGDDEEDPERHECDCDGTGRHTFELEVEGYYYGVHNSARTLRVHVIDVEQLDYSYQPNLPPAAEPGMWLVRLAVHDG